MTLNPERVPQEKLSNAVLRKQIVSKFPYANISFRNYTGTGKAKSFDFVTLCDMDRHTSDVSLKENGSQIEEISFRWRQSRTPRAQADSSPNNF